MALDLSGQTPPTPRANPRKVSAGNNSKAAEKAREAKTEERAEGLNGLFQLGAFGAIMFGGRLGLADAGACAQHGPPVAREAAALAETNESLGKTIDFLTAIGPYAGVLAAAMPFALQILLNHGRIPNVPQLAQFGVVSPEVMVQRAELEAARQAAELQAQMAAQYAEVQRMQAEMAENAA